MAKKQSQDNKSQSKPRRSKTKNNKPTKRPAKYKILETLAKKAEGGDWNAYNDLCDAYRQTFYSKTTAMIKNEELAKELCQDAFNRGFEEILAGVFKPTRSFYKYVWNKIYFAVSDYFKKNKEIPFSEIFSSENDDRPDNVDLSDNSPNPEETLLRQEEIALERSRIRKDILVKLEQMRLSILCSAKPHQSISFIFHRLFNWKIEKVISETTDQKLGEISAAIKDHLMQLETIINQDLLFDCFSPLLEKNKKYVEDIYKEKKYAHIRKDYQSCEIQELFFNVFYTRTPRDCIYDWCYKVVERMKKASQQGKLCSN